MRERALERWLVDKQADPELRRLLRAGRSDGPRPQALRMAPLAISALLTVNAAASAAPLAESVRNAFTSALIKWFAAGAVVGAASITVTQGLRQEQPDDTKLMQHALPVARPRVSVPPTPLPALEPVPIDPPQSSPAPVKVRARRPDVAREVALLDAARSALLQGDARRALATLAGLDRLPARSLQPEATVLRVRALLASNDVEGARQAAARFVAAAPGSPQAPVLRGLFAEPLEASERFGTTPEQSAIQPAASEL